MKGVQENIKKYMHHGDVYHDNDEKETMTNVVMKEILFKYYGWEVHHGHGEKCFILQNISWML